MSLAALCLALCICGAASSPPCQLPRVSPLTFLNPVRIASLRPALATCNPTTPRPCRSSAATSLSCWAAPSTWRCPTAAPSAQVRTNRWAAAILQLRPGGLAGPLCAQGARSVAARTLARALLTAALLTPPPSCSPPPRRQQARPRQERPARHHPLHEPQRRQQLLARVPAGAYQGGQRKGGRLAFIESLSRQQRAVSCVLAPAARDQGPQRAHASRRGKPRKTPTCAHLTLAARGIRAA